MILGVKLKQGIEWLNNFNKLRHSAHALARTYKTAVIPNGEQCPIIVMLLNSSAKALLDEYLNNNDASIMLGKENIPILAAALKDMVVFSQGATSNRVELVEMLVPAVAGRHYILQNHQALESSMSRCSQWPLDQKAILPNAFQLSVPTPGAQNVCRHMQPSLGVPAGGEQEREGGPPCKKPRRDGSGFHQTNEQRQSASDVAEGNGQEDAGRQQPMARFETMATLDHVCFMTYLVSGEGRSPCEGVLTSMDELAREQIPADAEDMVSGIVNMADLVLRSRDLQLARARLGKHVYM